MALAPLPPEIREKMLNSPAAKPPPGVEPNFDNPSSMAFSAEATLHGLYALSTIIFFIKIYGPLRIERRMCPEDYVLTLAWVSRLWLLDHLWPVTYISKVIYTGAFQPVGVLLARAPMGVHQWDITWRQFGRYLFVRSVLSIIRSI